MDAAVKGKVSLTAWLAKEEEASEKLTVLKPQAEDVNTEMVRRYQSPPPQPAAPATPAPDFKAEPGPNPQKPNPQKPAAPSVSVGFRSVTGTLSSPGIRKSTSLVREDDYGLSLAAFYGQVRKLDDSGLLKNGVKSPDQSYLRNA